MFRGLQGLDRRLRGLSVQWKQRLTAVVVFAGALALAYYFSWWLLPDGRFGIWRLASLALMLAYVVLQVLFSWYAYLRIRLPPERGAPEGLDVDVLVPVFSESRELVEAALLAARSIRYPHRTWLLDDSSRDELRELAREIGVGYLRREGREGNKAGNVNHALSILDGEFVTIFDIDHLAEPHFLDTVLGHFDDPRVGFVQALVAHRNQRDSFVAKAASGQADDVFGPTSMGWNGCGAAMVWGAHCTFRRAALTDIGGYRVGLAEDLLTSSALHVAGWRSVYVPKIVARGLVPSDLGSHFLQHFKWASGVLGTLVGARRRILRRLRLEQLVCYLTRMSYYLIGPVFFGHLLLLTWSLFTGVNLNSYFLHTLPIAISVIVIRKMVGAMWEQDPRAGWQLMGTALALSTWPVYILALAVATLRLRLPHVATPKEARGGNFLLLVVPQLVVCLALLVGVAVALRRGPSASDLTRVTAAIGAVAVHSVAFWGVVEGRRQRAGALRGGG